MNILRDEKGQMLILTALSMTVLFGFLAFATDVGLMFRSKRNAQIAADAAATAGAVDIRYGSTNAFAEQDAWCAAYINGYKGTNSSYSCADTVPTNASNATVTINTPPVYGAHKFTGFVEAIVTDPNPTIFMNMLGFHSMNVSARAVAGPVAISDNCIYLLNTSGIDLYVRGSATITTTDGTKACGIVDNSTSDNALYVTGSGNTINAAYINVVGGQSGSGSVPNSTVYTGASSVTDPLHDIIYNGLNNDGQGLSDLPACTSSNTWDQTTLSQAQALTIGSNGNIGGTWNSVYCFSQNVTIGNGVQLTGGTFIFENGVTIPGGATVTFGVYPDGTTTPDPGSTAPDPLGATIDVAGGIFNQSTNSILNVIAPQESAWWNDGIGLLVPSTNTQYTSTTCKANPNDADELWVQFGSSGQTFDGKIYAPSATLALHDMGGTNTYTGIIAGSMCNLSSDVIIPSYDNEHPYTTNMKTVALVE